MKECEYCHSPAHIWIDCPKKPVGWKPARLVKKNAGSPSQVRPLAHNEVTVGSNPTPATKSTAARINARVMVDCVCEACGSKFKAVPHEVKRGNARTCSKHCAAKLATRPDQSGHNNPNWKGGVPKTEKNKRYVGRYPEKHEAHRLMTNAIRRGDLVRQPCEVCGEPKVDGHHDDYSKPLDVRWLCRIHHIEAHKGRFGQVGTQALPVDTIRKPGRPKTGFNKTLYNREYMRKRRAANRASS